MARQNGTAHSWFTPTSNASLGDDASSTSTRRIFTAIERVTVVEFGAIIGDHAHVPNASFAFKALTRVGGDSANDAVVPAFKAAFAAEGGPGGDSSNSGFDNANQLANGIVTNAASGFSATPDTSQALRAYCEVTLNKGDQFVLAVTTGGGASSTVVFYAKAFADGAGLIEACDVDSN